MQSPIVPVQNRQSFNPQNPTGQSFTLRNKDPQQGRALRVRLFPHTLAPKPNRLIYRTGKVINPQNPTGQIYLYVRSPRGSDEARPRNTKANIPQQGPGKCNAFAGPL